MAGASAPHTDGPDPPYLDQV